MARNYQYTTLDRILSKLYRDLGLEEISETDVVEWTGEALEGIGTVSLYEEAVAFIEVENHEADLPFGLHTIIQVARNNNWTKETKQDCLCPANIKYDCTTEQIIQNPSGCGCGGNTPGNSETTGAVQQAVNGDYFFNNGKDYVFMDCHGHLIGDYDIAYYRPYFDLQWEYSGWMGSKYYREAYTPIRLANHSFFGSVVMSEDMHGNSLYGDTCSSVDEYTISGDKIRTSFREGSIAISYYRQKLDPDTGYPMIPDDYSTITAITMYITMKYMGRMWYLGREGYGDKYQKAEVDWQWYCRQAGNQAMKIYGVDQHENFKDMNQRLIPQRNRYYGFFGKMSRPENTVPIKDPNRRNTFFRRL